MGKVYESINDEWAGWISAQPMFFVATAPADPQTHVNLSPAGSTPSGSSAPTASPGSTSPEAASRP